MGSKLPLRIGILGAARIAPHGIIQPARRVAEAEVVAIAVRDVARARQFAARHTIPHVHETYQALIDDPEIDAIYNPLPNSLHGEWTIRALRAGKHVLCEKPMAANAAEAVEMATVAEGRSLVLMEAFHNLYHPLAQRMKEIVDSGKLGKIRHVEAHFAKPMLRKDDIRWRYDLAGGVMMDMGCYPVRLLRFLLSAEPAIASATARLHAPQIDRTMTAELHFTGENIDCTGRVSASFAVRTLLRIHVVVRGDAGTLMVLNPYVPHLFNWLLVRGPQGRRYERVRGETSYTHQLRAFVETIRHETPIPTNPQDAVANMRVLDSVYQQAGLKLRPGSLEI